MKRVRWEILIYPMALGFAWPFVELVRKSLISGGGEGAGEAAGLEAYASLLTDTGFWRALGNSVMLAGGMSVVATLMAALAGFGLAVYPFRGRTIYVAVLLGLTALPPQLLIPGGYELVARLGLLDSFGAVILPAALSVFGVLLYRSAFETIPVSLLEAARLDGCSEWEIFWRIAMPLVLPTTAVGVLMGFAGNYNAVVWPAVMLQSPSLHTLPVKLAAEAGVALTGAEQARVTAGTVLGLIPVLLLFLVLQRSFLPPLRGSGK